jgi:hypothetical protein
VVIVCSLSVPVGKGGEAAPFRRRGAVHPCSFGRGLTPRNLRPRCASVLDGWELRRGLRPAASVGDAAGVRQQHCPELGRREAGELAEVTVEVGLVVVAALERDLGEARRRAGRLSEEGLAPSKRAARPKRKRRASVFGGRPTCSLKRALRCRRLQRSSSASSLTRSRPPASSRRRQAQATSGDAGRARAMRSTKSSSRMPKRADHPLASCRRSGSRAPAVRARPRAPRAVGKLAHRQTEEHEGSERGQVDLHAAGVSATEPLTPDQDEHHVRGTGLL